MVQVLPGDQTGLYYIIVSSLPFTCTWQRLKDFVKNHPDGTFVNVDHAFVYPGSGMPCSGDGWVRIVGRPDFEKAFARLNGAVLDNRALVVDGRNKDKVLNLRDIALMNPSPSRNPKRSTVSTATSDYVPNPPSPVYYNSDGSPTTPFARQKNHENWNLQQQATSNYAPPSPSFSNHSSYYQAPPQNHETKQGTFQVSRNQDCYAIPTTRVLYVGNMAPVYTCMPAAPYMSVPPVMHNSLARIDPNTNAEKNTPPGTVQPEARKIIITKLSRDVKDRDLRNLLYTVCSKYRPETQSEKISPIHSIEMPRFSDNKFRGHAFVVFDSQGLAEHAVLALDKLNFQNRSLSAKFAKEGVEPVGGYGNSNSELPCYTAPPSLNPISNSDSHRSGSSRRETERALAVSSDSYGKGKKSQNNKGREKGTDTGARSKEKDNKQPCVVDGSGRKGR